MAKYLVTFNDTIVTHDGYVEVNGLTVMTDKDVERFEYLANCILWEFDYELNGEQLSYSNGEDFLNKIEYKEISNKEFEVLNNVFDGPFGVFIGEEQLEEIVGAEEEEEDFDEDEEDFDDSDY